jgi:hypothetical protein
MKILKANTEFLSKYQAGQFRFIVKCRAGFMTVVDAREWDNKNYMKHPETIISGYKKGALQSVQFQPEGTDIWLTVFARTGKKIKVIDSVILNSVTVGTINCYWINTELYNQDAYRLNGAKTWADKAYSPNPEKAAEIAA